VRIGCNVCCHISKSETCFSFVSKLSVCRLSMFIVLLSQKVSVIWVKHDIVPDLNSCLLTLATLLRTGQILPTVQNRVTVDAFFVTGVNKVVFRGNSCH